MASGSFAPSSWSPGGVFSGGRSPAVDRNGQAEPAATRYTQRSSSDAAQSVGERYGESVDAASSPPLMDPMQIP